MALGRKTGGRIAGTPNKATRDVREAFRTLVQNNLDRMQKALNELWRDRPGDALKHIEDLAEFCIPKLARTELTGENGNRLVIEIKPFGGENGETHGS